MGLTAEAKITKASVKPGTDGYGAKAPQLVLEVSIDMPAMKPVPTFEAWCVDKGWQLDRVIEDCQRARAGKPATKPRGAKDCDDCDLLVLKGQDHTHAWQCGDCEAWFDNEEAATTHSAGCDGPRCATCGRLTGVDDDDDADACRCPRTWCCEKHATEQRERFERENAAAIEHNRKAWSATQHAGVFIALVNAPVRISLEPAQSSMAEMFPLLAAAEESR